MEIYNTTVVNTHLDELNPEITSLFNNSLTKNGKQILQILYEQPESSHKELYEAIGTSASSLSNLISKIEQITPKLLNVEKRGRNSFYSLSPIARDYVKQELIENNAKKIRPFQTQTYTNVAFDQATSALKDFQQAAGKDWDLKLDELLNDNAMWVDSKLYGFFHTFIENIIVLRKSGKNELLDSIYTIINQNILIKRIQNYLNKQLLSYYQLEALFTIENTNIQAAMELVDEIFYFLVKCNFNPVSIPTTDKSITSEEYYGLIKCICQMKEEFDRFYSNHGKAQAVRDWKQKYHSESILLFYIAEKCCTCCH